MAQKPLSEKECRAAVEAVERNGGNQTYAALELGIARPTFAHRLISARQQYGLVPKIKAVRGQQLSPIDPIEDRRKRDVEAELRAALKEAERRAARAEDVRSQIFGLAKEPLRPTLDLPKRSERAKGGRTAVLHLTDIHYGEVIVPEKVQGFNRYDAEIARKRLGRFFSKAGELLTEHWKGAPPDEIVLCVGGDLVSGNIHPELEQTNFPSLPETIREVGEQIAGGIRHLLTEVKRPIRVYSVPGNHGRTSPKPQSKTRASSSFDLLATDFAEATCNAHKLKITWFKSQSADACFSTYGWRWCLNHGDTMGGGSSGTGFIGPMATIIKGHRKIVDVYARAGHQPVHFVLTGHYHTTGKTPFGWAGGSVCGYSELAIDLRADPEPARQNMLIVQPYYGVIDEMPLYLGAPDEGSIYLGPTTIVRPNVA